MEKVPFTYGRIAADEDFTDRQAELKRLIDNFDALVNTILISPRRWGKTSLVKEAGAICESKHKNLKVISIDIFNIRDEKEFYLALSNRILKATSNSWEDFAANAKLFLSRFIPTVTFSPDKQTDLSFGISWKELEKHPDDILDLAENIARKKELQLVICIDEFQNIMQFGNPDAFQQKLRSHWQNHQQVVYCLYGSKRHILRDIFSDPSKPFYKFGDLMLLDKIPESEWIVFLCRRFQDTGKTLLPDDARLIARLADNHPYYVQQLAQQAWFRTDDECNQDIVLSAHEDIVNQLSLLFANSTEKLSSFQIHLLKAVLSGEKQLTAKETLEKYQLGTSANVVRLKRLLIENEILDDTGEELSFLDPMYKYWLQKNFFKK